MPLVTKAEFARRLGVTGNAIRQALDVGRIESSTDNPAGREMIDYESQLINFVRTTRDIGVLKRFRDLRKNITQDAPPPAAKPNGRKKGVDKYQELFDKSPDEMDAADAAELTAIVKAKKAALEYQKMDNTMVDVDVVLDIFEDISTNIRQAVLALPDRVVPQMEGLDYDKRYAMMQKECREILETLNKNIKKKMLDETT